MARAAHQYGLGTFILFCIIGLLIAFVIAVMPWFLQVPFVGAWIGGWLVGLLLASTRNLPVGTLLGISATMVVLATEPLFFFGGPIFVAAWIVFPVGAFLHGLVGGILSTKRRRDAAYNRSATHGTPIA
ncbi:MAG: hypothetical protein WD904_04365 [Dehalococcoidia bacterium]